MPTHVLYDAYTYDTYMLILVAVLAPQWRKGLKDIKDIKAKDQISTVPNSNQ